MNFGLYAQHVRPPAGHRRPAVADIESMRERRSTKIDVQIGRHEMNHRMSINFRHHIPNASLVQLHYINYHLSTINVTSYDWPSTPTGRGRQTKSYRQSIIIMMDNTSRSLSLSLSLSLF